MDRYITGIDSVLIPDERVADLVRRWLKNYNMYFMTQQKKSRIRLFSHKWLAIIPKLSFSCTCEVNSLLSNKILRMIFLSRGTINLRVINLRQFFTVACDIVVVVEYWCDRARGVNVTLYVTLTRMFQYRSFLFQDQLWKILKLLANVSLSISCDTLVAVNNLPYVVMNLISMLQSFGNKNKN